MRRTYKFQLRPTSKQIDALIACLDVHRELYNAALQERRDAYKLRGVSVRYGMQSAQLKEIRAVRPDVAVWSFSSQQATLRRLNKAFAAFFRRVKAGQAPGYPRFKGRNWFDTVVWPSDGDGCRWMTDERRVRLQGIGQVKVNQHRAIKGTVKTISIKREGRRWYLVLSCEDIPAESLEPTGAVVGIDMGVTHFASTSDAEHIENPRHGRKGADRLAKAQQALSRCKRGSNRRHKARERVAAAHRKVRNQRVDFHHKTALALVREYDVIAHEALRVANMSRSASGTMATPGTNVAAKSGLNQSIADAGWSGFLSILTYKAESAGRLVIAVEPANTSRTCTACGHCAAGNRSGEAFRCLTCGHVAHADVNAAVNILRAGLARQAAQAA